jgi:hypothetical protein
MPVSFSNNSLKVVDDQTLAYTVQKGSTLCGLAKEIADESGRSYASCYADLLKQNDFHDAKLNPAGKRDPNLIYAKDAKHEADVLKFTVDATAKDKLSSFCMSATPPADVSTTMRSAEVATTLANQGARFAPRSPVVYASCEELDTEVCTEEDPDYAERFYYEGEDGVSLEVESWEVDELMTSNSWEEDSCEDVPGEPLESTE